ncbi:hypothetical protein R1flu_023309 [Riccia fluitans]|uniref:Uncharacterized protein n=1 Tax=Riccia fluitans TaxID=41844 RepID=A0ABD1XRN8_9MARC
MLKLANVQAESRQQEGTKSESSKVIEQIELVSSPDEITQILCAIPGLEVHDAHSLMFGIGSIDVIAQSSTEAIIKFTDLAKEKARGVDDFFGNEIYNRTPVLD